MEMFSEHERFENGVLGHDEPRLLARFVLSILEMVDNAMDWEEDEA